MDFMSSSKQNLSFTYFNQILENENENENEKDNEALEGPQTNLKRFNDYFLVKDHVNFKGLNLIHRSYVSLKKNGFSTLFDGKSLEIGPYCVIEEECRLENGGKIGNSVVLRGVTIEANVEVKESILGERVKIGEGSRILNSSVIAEGVEIPGKHLLKQAKIARIK